LPQRKEKKPFVVADRKSLKLKKKENFRKGKERKRNEYGYSNRISGKERNHHLTHQPKYKKRRRGRSSKKEEKDGTEGKKKERASPFNRNPIKRKRKK